jgi:hypothetical protein
MSRHIEIYDTENYSSYEVAKSHGAVYSFDDIEIEDQHGFHGGMGLDIINAMQLALKMVGQSKRLGAVLIESNPVVDRYY